MKSIQICKKRQNFLPFFSSFRWEIPIVINSSSASFWLSSEIIIESVESILPRSVFSSMIWLSLFLYSSTIFRSEIFVLVSRAACEKISRALPPSFETEISRRRGRISRSAKKNRTASFRVSRGSGTEKKGWNFIVFLHKFASVSHKIRFLLAKLSFPQKFMKWSWRVL